jgi:hypothetical protein
MLYSESQAVGPGFLFTFPDCIRVNTERETDALLPDIGNIHANLENFNYLPVLVLNWGVGFE